VANDDQFWGGGNVYVLGVSDSTTASPYSPAVAVFNNSTHALVCATSNNTCAGTPASWTSGAVSYPVGHSVQEDICVPSFTPPASQLKAAAFSDGRLTNYKSTRYGFSGYFTTSPLIMTGPGSVTEANAGALNSTADGFSTFLVP
jgi:hypothetical protein